jgi:hypothetical protein
LSLGLGEPHDWLFGPQLWIFPLVRCLYSPFFLEVTNVGVSSGMRKNNHANISKPLKGLVLCCSCLRRPATVGQWLFRYEDRWGCLLFTEGVIFTEARRSQRVDPTGSP